MKALQPDDHQDRIASLCAPCVYYSKNLDPSFSPPGAGQHTCALGFEPGDERCREMRTNSCSMRKRKA